MPMANTQLKKQKRKRRLEQTKAKQQQCTSLTYEGNKYKTAKLTPLMLKIEQHLINIDAGMPDDVDQRLNDSVIKTVYENLIKKISQNDIDISKDCLRTDHFGSTDFTIGLEQFIAIKVSEAMQERSISEKEVVGTLRTLNSSLKLGNGKGVNDRGYLEFLREFIPRNHTDEDIRHLI